MHSIGRPNALNKLVVEELGQIFHNKAFVSYVQRITMKSLQILITNLFSKLIEKILKN